MVVWGGGRGCLDLSFFPVGYIHRFRQQYILALIFVVCMCVPLVGGVWYLGFMVLA